MISEKILTLKDIIEWAESRGIPLDSPIGYMLSDREDGRACRGVIYEHCINGDFEERPDIFDIENYCFKNDYVGEYCYFAGINPLEEVEKYPNEETAIIMLTDGFHLLDPVKRG